jgi:succinate dehydrogenase flavin-adding protein (antitoxin of CptAB toxin-antitoxin module)
MLRNLRISSHFLRISASLRTVSTTPFRPADPWILPNTPAHVSSTQTPPADSHFPDVQPLIRKNESLDRLISRLTYQSRKRGTLETDLLLSTFAKDQLLVMTEEELKEYDKVSVKPLDFFSCFLPSQIAHSCSTNQIGIFITGRRVSGSRRNVGPTQGYWRSSGFMLKTKGRLYGVCRL